MACPQCVRYSEFTVYHNYYQLYCQTRSAMDRKVPDGGKATLSEQLQPVYETKALVTQQMKTMEGILSHLNVRNDHLYIASLKCNVIYYSQVLLKSCY